MADPRNTNPQSEKTGQPTPGRTATPGNAPQTAGPASKAGPNQDEISRRAYELFQKRGAKHGYHMEDWREAERQLREERQAGGGTSTAKSAAKKSTAKKSAAKKSAAKKSGAKKSGAKKSAAKKSSGAG